MGSLAIQQDNETAPVEVPKLDPEGIKKLGVRLFAQFDQYQKDRYQAELQWLENIRQFRGIYDPEVAKRIEDDRSHAYPKITRTKCIGTIARLMEMLFPNTEKNWGVAPSPLPDLSIADLQSVLDHLQQENQTGAPLTDDQIEKGVMSLAQAKADKLSTVMEDQLDEIDYVQLARKVVRSGVIYSAGVLKGPMIKEIKSRTWTVDASTKQLKATEVKKLRPVYEDTNIWNYYPDMSAKEFEQMDGEYERHIGSRQQLRELSNRPDFMGTAVLEYLRNTQTGNYKEKHWETTLRSKGDRRNASVLAGRKYEWWEYWGAVSGHELKACGIDVPDDQLHIEVNASVWGIDNVVIKALITPMPNTNMYHKFVFEDDDISLLGNGLPVTLRDSQMAVAEAARMLLDNASVVCGPTLEVNVDLLMPGQDLDLHAYKVFLREGTGTDASQPAVRGVNIDSHIGELMQIITLFSGFADNEASLPPPAMGDVSSGSEAYRTSSGASMLLGAAALPIRDTVRNFDRFTTSFITSLVEWNMQFGNDDSVRGDYSVIARGSTSLVAKEVRSHALAMLSQTMTPDERVYVSTKKLLIERMKANDIPLDVLEDEDVVAQKLQEQSKQAADQASQQQALLAGQVKEMIASAFKDIALANAASARTTTDSFNSLVKGVSDAKASEDAGSGASKASVSSSA